MKTRLEVTPPDNLDPFPVLNSLMIEGKVYRANMVDFETVVIFYETRKITETELKEAIGIRKSDGDKLKQTINA